MPNKGRRGGFGQAASKVGHSAFVDNPDIQEFLGSCSYMREPTEAEQAQILGRFSEIPETNAAPPDVVIAIDGSPYESNFRSGLPSTRAGFIKISGVAISVPKYRTATDNSKRNIDPFEIAAIYEQKDALTICLPSSNMRYAGEKSVAHGFRKKLYEELTSRKTAIVENGDTFLDTLFKLVALGAAGQGRTGSSKGFEQDGDRYIRVHKCASCGIRPPAGILVSQMTGPVICGNVIEGGCDGTIYASDVLRVHETVSNQGPNLEAITRTMNAVEAIFMAHLINHLIENSPRSLSKACFVVDGPLALFGESAWLHSCLLRLCHEANERLAVIGLPELLLFGIQKTGQLVEHGDIIQPYLPSDGRELIFAVDDAYRSEFVKQSDDTGKNFGDETYWGQDFLYRSTNGDIFALGLPYPFAHKRPEDPAGEIGAEEYFRNSKAELARYITLPRVVDVVRLLRSDLYQSSLVPVLAAHREASISLLPGGKVLDLMSLSSFSASEAK